MTARPTLAAASAALLVGAAGSCARPSAPPGGPPDNLPPLVAATYPDTFAVVEDFEGPVRIEFSERISRQSVEGAEEPILISPRTGIVETSFDRDALEVDLLGGFQPGLVYRVTVRPVVVDMFGNNLREPFEFVFSTGADFTPGALAGITIDRITGRPAARLSIQARPLDDTTLVHVARSDPEGIYTLRFVPPGRYELVAFEDRNRDRTVDPFEVQGRDTAELALGDTTFQDLIVLLPDTTPAVPGQVELVDSATLRITTDDFLDPESGTERIVVGLEPDSAAEEGAPPPPAVQRVLTDSAFQVYRDSVAEARRAAADSARADTAGAEVPEDEPDAELPGDPESPARPSARPANLSGQIFLEGPLPFQAFLVVLAEPLPPEVPFVVVVDGLVNVNGVPGGGGRRSLTRPAPPPDTAEADTTGVGADTASVAPDTTSRL